jgi:hypothetical protein
MANGAKKLTFSPNKNTMFTTQKKETLHYSKEASELNRLIIKLKKEVLKGTITSITLD